MLRLTVSYDYIKPIISNTVTMTDVENMKLHILHMQRKRTQNELK